MKRKYTRPSISPACTPNGFDVSILAWMDETGLDCRNAPALWADLGDVLEALEAANTLAWFNAGTGEWVSA